MSSMSRALFESHGYHFIIYCKCPQYIQPCVMRKERLEAFELPIITSHLSAIIDHLLHRYMLTTTKISSHTNIDLDST